jgi:hypothetical protein
LLELWILAEDLSRLLAIELLEGVDEGSLAHFYEVTARSTASGLSEAITSRFPVAR